MREDEFKTGDRVELAERFHDGAGPAPKGTVIGFAHGDRIEVEWLDDEPNSREYPFHLKKIGEVE